jgi:hypothetical protein
MIDRHIALAAAGLVIAGHRRDPFEQRRFAGAVLADDDGDRVRETQLEIVLQERQAERIGGAVGNFRGSSQSRFRYGAGSPISRCFLPMSPSSQPRRDGGEHCTFEKTQQERLVRSC